METQISRRLIRREVARDRAGISRTTEHRLLTKDPTWPRPRRITSGLTGYFEDELDRWIETRPEANRRSGGRT